MGTLTTRIAATLSFAALSFCLLAESTGRGSEYQPDRVAGAIRYLQPALAAIEAERLARIIETVADEPECGLPWQVLVSIAFHESSLGMRTLNARTKDYGLMQVNRKNVLRFGLSQARVEKDAGYSLRFACKLLRDNRERYSEKYPYWLGIYRSGTALWRADIRANAKRYDKIIRRTAKRIGYDEAQRVAWQK